MILMRTYTNKDTVKDTRVDVISNTRKRVTSLYVFVKIFNKPFKPFIAAIEARCNVKNTPMDIFQDN